MKLPVAAAVILACTVLLQPVMSQSSSAEQLKQITIAPLNGARGNAHISAFTIERGDHYPSVIHASGRVEVRTNGFVLNADEADYNEDTGEIQARGAVNIKPYPPLTGGGPNY
jgi:lipopolysaccharide assembly outer membrane protein LptD (OstA)